MYYRKSYIYIQIITCFIFIMCLPQTNCLHAQTLKGKVYAFKNLELKSIQVKSKKSGNITYTNQDGSFSLQCHPKDKIVFSGNGFERTCESYSNDSVYIKMIFKGGSSEREKAINNGHVTEDHLLFCLKYQAAYNDYPSPRKMYSSRTNNESLKYTHFSKKHNYLHRTQGDYEFSMLENK